MLGRVSYHTRGNTEDILLMTTRRFSLILMSSVFVILSVYAALQSRTGIDPENVIPPPTVMSSEHAVAVQLPLHQPVSLAARPRA